MPFPLPTNVHPEPKICLKITIPDDAVYRQTIIGHLHQLTRWFNHDRDDAHTAKQVGEEWMKAFLTIELEDCDEMACCPDQTYISYAVYQQQQIIYQEHLNLIDDGNTAASFDAPENFNGSGSDNENYALCRVINNIVGSTLRDAAMGMSVINDVLGAINRALPLLHPITGFVGTVAQRFVSGHLEDLINDCEAIRAVACCMRDAMNGQPTTITNLQNSLDSCGFTFGSHEAEIASMVNMLLQDKGNARAAIASMRATFDSAGTPSGANQNDCDCGCPCDSADFQPVDYLATGCDFQYMGNCVWGIFSASEANPNASMSDAQGRVFRIGTPDVSLGFPLAGCSTMSKTGACGDDSMSGVGCNFSTGVWGGRMTQVSWQSASGFWNYYTVELVPDDECEE